MIGVSQAAITQPYLAQRPFLEVPKQITEKPENEQDLSGCFVLTATLYYLYIPAINIADPSCQPSTQPSKFSP